MLQINFQLFLFSCFGVFTVRKGKQDGRLAPAFFSPNYNYFDQLLQTVKNKTTVLILVFKEFLQTSFWPLIFVLYAKGYHDFLSKLFCLTIPKNFVGNPLVFQKISGIENFFASEGYVTIFCRIFFLSHSTEEFRRGTLLCCVPENFR